MTNNHFQQFQIHDQRLLGFHAVGSLQLANQSPSAPSMERYDIRTASQPHDRGCLWVEVYLNETHHDRIGWAQFSGTKDRCICENVHIEVQHRRLGIASAMYDIAEDVFKVSVAPTSQLSPEVEQFWQDRQG